MIPCTMIITLFTGTLFFFSRKNIKDEEDDEESKKSKLLCRFVFDGSGRKIGESISVMDDDLLIIKLGGKYLGVPLKHIEENEKSLLVKGLINFDKAEEMGEQWRRDAFSEMHQKDESEGKEDGF